jgi:hypothetical protein
MSDGMRSAELGTLDQRLKVQTCSLTFMHTWLGVSLRTGIFGFRPALSGVNLRVISCD